MKDEAAKATKTVGLSSDGQFWIEKVLDHIKSLEKLGGYIPTVQVDGSDLTKLRKRAFKTKSTLLSKVSVFPRPQSKFKSSRVAAA